MDSNGIKYEFEPHTIPYLSSVNGGWCKTCSSGKQVAQRRRYLPDFWLPDYGFYIEVKGRLDSTNRKKLRDIKGSNPELDLRIMFLSNNKISSGKPGRYSDWAEKNDYIYAIKELPWEWFQPTNK